MDGTQMKVIDPTNEREQLASAGVAVNRYGTGLVQLTFLSFRNDTQAAVDGRLHVMPQIAVVGRYILTDQTAVALKKSIGVVVTDSRELVARVLPNDKGGHA